MGGGGGGKGGGGRSTPITHYYLSVHYGICRSVDELLAVYCDEETMWSGSMTESSATSINLPSLFGGTNKEGGVVGLMQYLDGASTSLSPVNLAGRFNRTPTTCPAFRGQAALFFSGDSLYNITTYVRGTQTTGSANVVSEVLDPDGTYTITETLSSSCTNVDLSGYEYVYYGDDGITKYYRNVDSGKIVRVVQQDTGANEGIQITTMYVESTSTSSGWTKVVTPAYDRSGFRWASNNPYLKGIWAKVRRMPKTSLDQAYARIVTTYVDKLDTDGDGDTTETIQTIDANPAHMIFEALTNTEWGMGGATASIDVDSFETAAKTLYDEGLGLSIVWTKPSNIEDFINEIIDHISGTVYTSPATGLLTLKLIRGDYDESTLFEISPDNATMSSFQRTGWGETINEMTVTWTNPTNENEETVTVQDLGNISIQGCVVGDTRNYYGVRSPTLAQKLGERELRQASSPLAICEVSVDRTAFIIVPGDCVKLMWPDYGMDGVVMRVGKVDYGKPGAPQVKLSLAEDVFSLPTVNYDEPPRTLWEDTDEDPRNFDHARIVNLPYFAAMRAIGRTTLNDYEYPEIVAGVLAAQDSGDTHAYDLYQAVTNAAGLSNWERTARRTPMGRATTESALVVEANSVLSGLSGFIGEGRPSVGDFLWIGNDDTPEDETEIAVITVISDNGYTLRRGVLDTVPRVWDAGTVAWIMKPKVAFHDETIQSDGAEITYRLCPQTSRGVLPVAQATSISGTGNDRFYAPLRPANVRIGSVAFSGVQISSAVSSVSLTWSRRNRLFEDATVLSWEDGDVIPEEGQRTRIGVYDETGESLYLSEPILGTQYDLPANVAWRDQTVTIRLWSERDGYSSFQSYDMQAYVFVPPAFMIYRNYITLNGLRVTVSKGIAPLLPRRPILLNGYSLYIAGKRIVIQDRDAILTILGDVITFGGGRVIMR